MSDQSSNKTVLFDGTVLKVDAEVAVGPDGSSFTIGYTYEINGEEVTLTRFRDFVHGGSYPPICDTCGRTETHVPCSDQEAFGPNASCTVHHGWQCVPCAGLQNTSDPGTILQ